MLPTRLIRLCGNALGEEVAVGVGRGRPQDVAQDVGGEPVQLLRHGPVARAQARLEMDGRDAELGPDQSAGDRRIDVADHDQPVRPVRLGDLAIGDHHLAGLLGMAARADAEVEIGLGQAEIGEEIGRHVGVVMLAGMDEQRRDDRRSPSARARAGPPS